MCCLLRMWQVSPVEVAAAVREMLAAAAMPLDLERSALLEQSLALQQQLAARARRRLRRAAGAGVLWD